MLKIKDLRKSYGTFELNCSMEIPAGCITGLVGSNGAGKSTTFKSVLGLISIDGGSIEVFGKEIHTWTKAEKQRMGVVLANGGFNTYLTMKDMETVLSRMYPRFDRAMFREYCRRYQLPADKRIKEFSTGMLAKAKILAAITHKADLLLLDEPTTGLDVLAREELLDMLRAYMEENEERTILISSHISTDLEGLCDDLYMIDNGEIVLHEEMDVLLGQYGILKVTQSQFDAMEKQYLLRVMKESYGYSLSDQRKAVLYGKLSQPCVRKGKRGRSDCHDGEGRSNMKGLLLKDFALMKGQRRFFLMLLLIGMIPALAGGNVGFLTVYLPFGFCFFTISTISYDEIDNSLPFLLILPVSRREYAGEKYVYGIICGVGTLVLCQLLGIGYGIFHDDFLMIPYFVQGGVTAVIMIVFFAIMIPIQLKFGSEKGRIFLFAIVIAVMGSIAALNRLLHLSIEAEKAVGFLADIPVWGYILGSIVLCVLALGISYSISVKIMEKKEL